ncbi:MAG: endonuclease/exonuclease/phosphatase family protein [Noviherbaspirillum sp.]
MQLITWNIQWGRGCDGRVDLARIVEHARALADFDVLCLQEMADNFPALKGNDDRNQFTELAALLPGYTAIDGIAVDLPGGQRRRRFGNMILSRLPVRQVYRHLLPSPVDTTVRSMRRMAIEAVVAPPFGLVRVMSTHLEYYSAAQRAAQVEALRGLHAEACADARGFVELDSSEGSFRSMPRPASAIITADFNFRPEDPLHARMQQPFDDGSPALHDAWTARWPGVPHPPTLGLYDRKQWPAPYASDFIFLTEDLLPRVADVRVDGQTQASDHQPVLITLQ